MTNFPYYDTVPATNDNPSDDQPLMLDNTVSIEGIWEVDHIGFGANNGGTHTQSSYANFQTSPVLPSDSGAANPSVAFPAAGIQDTGNAQYYFKNPVTTYVLNSAKAFGAFTIPSSFPVGGVITGFFGSNIVSITSNAGLTQFTIDLTTGAVNGTSVVVLLNDNIAFSNFFPSRIPFTTWSMTSNTLTITTTVAGSNVGGSRQISFEILQA